MGLGRFARTARHLKPVQIYGRAIAKLPRPAPDLGPAPRVREIAAAPHWPELKHPGLTGPTEARFLNEAGEIGTEGCWTDASRPKLWLYNLHYFDDLNAPGWADRSAWHERLVERWIAENPAGRGEGWEPFPTSLRIVNWIKWFQRRGGAPEAWRDSLAVQLRWLERNIEWRLLGNHLFENAKSLVFGGLYFDGEEAERWLARGLEILKREIAEQVLSDGGHFERSPMYHAIVLEDVLDLINMGQASGAVEDATLEAWSGVASRMVSWLVAMLHPDGEIGFFNDAAIGVAAKPQELIAYAADLGLGGPSRSGCWSLIWLKPSGYVRAALEDAVAIIDAAPIGPDYLPGHAHADTLSFELSLGDERVIVNGGTSHYAEGPDRLRERGTAAHSTVEIGGQDSSEVWAGFRVGRRARILHAEAKSSGGAVEVWAAHDGYRFLPGRPIHRRTWRLETGRLSITDEIEGGDHPAVARLHLAPGVGIELFESGRRGTLTTSGGRVIGWAASVPALVELSAWSVEFGRREPSKTLSFAFTGPRLETELSW